MVTPRRSDCRCTRERVRPQTSTNSDSDISLPISSPSPSDPLPASCTPLASIFDAEAVSPHAGVAAPSSGRTPSDEGVAFSDEFVSPTTSGKAQFTQRIPGRLKAFIDQWRSARAPAWILDIIQEGFLLPFKGGVTIGTIPAPNSGRLTRSSACCTSAP